MSFTISEHIIYYQPYIYGVCFAPELDIECNFCENHKQK